MKRVYIAILSLIVLAGCNKKEEQPVQANEQQQMNMMLTETFELKKSNPHVKLQLPAEIRADQRTEIFAKVNSYVTDLKVDIGDRVKKGQVLMILNAPELQAQVLSAEAKYKAQEANYISSKATYDRTLKANQTQGAIAPDFLEQITAKMLADQAQLNALKAAYQEVKSIDQYLVIKAPFDAVVTSRQVDVGAYVGPMNKTPLLIVEDTNKLRLNLSISEANTPYLQMGDTVSFTVRTMPQDRFKAIITRKAGSLDLKLRSEQVQADLDNSKGLLKPNMIADAVVQLKAKQASFFVPKSALVESNLGLYLIENKAGIAHHHKVRKGRTMPMMIEVFGDLHEGMRMLKMATEEIADGSKIN
ncbi:efflux RND transporter periplasmic adaptor subunit [Myroides sp. LoEW2-1]|uniref:efflux RND transporter periplasmic adaptor subunit n=1 Tax=Myroides sp. LoEW2-1 TaxID=2683192 RepID=UPI00132B92A4|nr:efflux RND transporter periplasmic adaptor subunit [Myroides sp. LoEW2-1]MVX35092.1 efflux RND transporter periplasmic adaptor subunit [Myroides sp. LoEW2-1]